jgi:hypothetical protein
VVVVVVVAAAGVAASFAGAAVVAATGFTVVAFVVAATGFAVVAGVVATAVLTTGLAGVVAAGFFGGGGVVVVWALISVGRASSNALATKPVATSEIFRIVIYHLLTFQPQRSGKALVKVLGCENFGPVLPG